MSGSSPTGDVVVGKRVRARRRELKMTQQELGQRAGCTRVWVRYIELGTGWPSPDMQRRIAAALETDVSIFDRPTKVPIGPLSAPPGAPLVTTASSNGNSGGGRNRPARASRTVAGNSSGTRITPVLWMAMEGLEALFNQIVDDPDAGQRLRSTEALIGRVRQLEVELAPLMLRAPQEREEFARLFARAADLREKALEALSAIPGAPFGARVWRARREMGLERDQAAAALQMSSNELLEVETGLLSVSADREDIMRLVLGVAPR